MSRVLSFKWFCEQQSLYVLKNFIVTNHLAKNHKISDLFRHLQVGQTECQQKRRILVGRQKLYISALRLEKKNGVSFTVVKRRNMLFSDYALRWETKSYLDYLKWT